MATAEGETGTVKLVYDGQTFFTTEITVAQKPLSKDDVTITGINDKYPSHEAAEAAKDGIGIVYDGKKLTTDDYTVSREDGMFTITFEGNYSGTVKQDYQVETGLPTVTVSDATFTYDGQNHTIVVNNPNNDDVKFSLSQSGYGAQIEKKAAGTYVIYWQATKEDKNVSGSATLVINKAKLTIKADNQSMYVGGTKPTFTYTATGLVKGDTLTTAPTLTCTADGMTVGKFDIVPSGADAGDNYEITYVNGMLTVSRRHSSPSSTTPDPEPTPDDSNSFSDVPANAYFADVVKWAVENGVTNGLSDTMFGPYASCTRAQIVTFLWRAAGSPEPKTASSFTDVPASAYYAKAVAWAIENGITNGMTETTFAPNATCTRGQSVTFLYRALGKKVESSTSFTDVKSDAFYADAVNWAVASDVTNGTSATTFSPNADCTRAEIVTFLYRAYQGK
ncbi:S-layer homology domain-containing protein [Oscillibacter sp. ER4]|uniref:S-layer homology domain-containing protein n=1 Tax=Oscillibacter sp. ER4 TaxID=1519439 RepID=UPI00051C3F2A|nr:S-layer homology domain-containing protein [Oscillibacter sp. ER4]